MAPPEQTRMPKHTRRMCDWKWWLYIYITDFLAQCKLGLYMAFCVGLYALVFRALPGRLPEIFLGVALLRGVPSGQPWGKVATLIRGLLEVWINSSKLN